MRNLVLFLTAILLGTTATFATTADDKVAERNAYQYNNSFIFVEEGITFSVYPDGEFDFYIDNRIGRNRRNVTFNSGFDYSPYAQYDDYGAVVQVENIPIYYDYYGRVSQVGSVDINYRNGRVNRLGNMYVYYNRRGFYDYHTGYINIYNRSYIYRPFHSFFARPAIGFCFVRTSPYRRYYNPFRYTYYNPYRYNNRHAYAKIGKTHRYNQVRRERAGVYRNDKRVALRESSARNNRTVARSNGNRKNGSVQRGALSNNNRNANRVAQKRSNSNTVRSSRNASADRSSRVSRSNNKKGDVRSSTSRTVKRSATADRAPQRKTVSNRTVAQTPRSRTATRSKTQYKKPQARSTQKSAQGTPSRSRSVQSRSTSSRSVAKAPSKSRNVQSRSTSSRSVKKAPTRSRSTAARSASSSRTKSNRSAVSSRSRGRQ